MKKFELMIAATGCVAALALCGCNAGKAKGTVPVEAHHGGMAHQSIYAGKRLVKTNLQAVANLEPASGSGVHGTILFVAEGDGVRVEGSITGLAPGRHGIHIHENGDCSSADASSAGGHFNPTHQSHGAPEGDTHHTGDFGNLTADASGVATISRVFAWLTLEGPDSIIGRSLVVHAEVDDLHSQPAGNSGARVACGVIQAR
jgi:superoxide dismutase, Cu-Zn family